MSAVALVQNISSGDKNAPAEDGRRHVLVIDDDATIIKLIEKILATQPVIVHTALSCQEGRAVIQNNPEVAVVICDQLLPDGLGVDVLRDLRTNYPGTVRVLTTGMYDKGLAIQAINSGEIYRFLVKPFTVEDLISTVLTSVDRYNLQLENRRLQEKLALQNEELKLANEELNRRVRDEESKSSGFQQQSSTLRKALQEMIDLCLEIEQRIDPQLFKHSQRVGLIAAALGREMGFDSEKVDKLQIAGQLHDIALLGTKPHLFTNQRYLKKITVDAERDLVRTHPELSAKLVKFLPMPDVVEAILQHHEYFDGSGYPEQVIGDRIAPMARILSVADSFDEMPVPIDYVMPAIEAASGKLYDTEVVRAMIRLLSAGFKVPRERLVLLSELQPGMKLASSVYTISGMLLVKQGQQLSDPMIRRLQQHGDNNAIAQSIFIEF